MFIAASTITRLASHKHVKSLSKSLFCAISVAFVVTEPILAQSLSTPSADQGQEIQTSPASNAYLIGADTANLSASLPQIALHDDTLLGPGDRIDLRVVSWRDTELEYQLWDAVSGQYTVSASGALNLPLVGAVQVAGLSRSVLAEDVARALQQRAQMVEPPAVTIEVEAFAPFFVLGDVARPGAFEASPGRTVYQAFALAGGAPRLAGGIDTNVRALMMDTGTLSQLRREITRAEVSAARYKAMLIEMDEINVPAGLQHPDGAAALARLIEGEQQYLRARREAQALEVENLSGLKDLLTTEIKSLEEKLDGLATQIDLAKENLANVTSLRESGLARSAQIRDAQEALFEVESQQIDIETAIFRARQRYKEAERDILALHSRDKIEGARELQKINGRLEELRLRRETYVGLVEAAGGEASTMIDQVSTNYFLTRAGDLAGEVLVLPDTILARGDVLRVERVLIDAPAELAAVAPALGTPPTQAVALELGGAADQAEAAPMAAEVALETEADTASETTAVQEVQYGTETDAETGAEIGVAIEPIAGATAGDENGVEAGPENAAEAVSLELDARRAPETIRPKLRPVSVRDQTVTQ